jgi:GNAT superfamily N-acetyltransferase
MSDLFGDWVTNEERITHFNDTERCICGNQDIPELGHFSNWYFCEECERVYIGGEDGAVHPKETLRTDNEGLVPASEDWAAFDLLTEKELDVQNYIELDLRAADETWLWAHEGVYIGYLLYHGRTLRALIIVEGYRGQGQGTRFVEQWFDQLDEENIKVMHFNRTEPFFEQLDIPYERI